MPKILVVEYPKPAAPLTLASLPRPDVYDRHPRPWQKGESKPGFSAEVLDAKFRRVLTYIPEAVAERIIRAVNAENA